ncbi:MAG: sugar phosphate isomerase/epimerase [Chitinophagaceae bacterium]|nr:sugar phosphate isomerase/epimerase [Chitinophagaceae bacterium]
MKTRREFLKTSGVLTAGSVLWSQFPEPEKFKNMGVQLYTFRKEMQDDAIGTLKKIASLGLMQIESARSEKGNYYGLSPKEMKKVCADLGMTLRSGHVHVDNKFQQTLNEAAEAGQEYLICSTMPTKGQTVDNYKKVAESFNKTGEACKKMNLKFGYHNHSYEFESENGQVLYDVLLKNTDAELVHMELDLGWVIVADKNPMDYFKNFQGRFPLWHLKDMNMAKKESTEFGKGGLDILQMLKQSKQSGMKYFFVEQEEYASTPFESMKENMDFIAKLKL